jgi:hypothetical protein
LLGNLTAEGFAAAGFFRGPSRPAYGALSAHRKKDGKDMAYAGPLSAAAASRGLAAGYTTSVLEKIANHTAVHWWIPIVVVDGHVATVQLEAGQLKVEPVGWGRLLISNPDVGSIDTVVDVVSRSALADYVSAVKDALSEVAARIEREPRLLSQEGFTLGQMIRSILPKSDIPGPPVPRSDGLGWMS